MPWTISEQTEQKQPDLIRKARSKIASFTLQPEPTPRTPRWNLPLIYQIAEDSWVLQEIYRVKIQETKRPGYDIYPRFKTKCPTCQTEFPSNTEQCPTCKTETAKPDQTQFTRTVNLFRRPNPDDKMSLTDIIGSITYHGEVAGDWYISILPKQTKIGLIPSQLFVEDPRFIKVVADEFGRLGTDEYFCPLCYKPDNTYTKIQYETLSGKCPTCSYQLERTAYQQTIGSETANRFSTRTMIHGSTSRILPELFGKPKIVSLWEPIHIVKAMDEYNFDVYTEGKLGMILNFPGYDIEQVSELKGNIETDIKTLDTQTASGGFRPKKTPRTLMLGSDQPMQKFDVMPNLTEMQSLEFYLMHISAICGLHGVQPLMISLPTGRQNAQQTPYIQLEVGGRPIKEIHQDIEETFNEQLLPIFGITDWTIRFGKVELKDELRDAQIFNYKVTSLVTLRNNGINAKLNDNGEIEITTYLEPTQPPKTKTRRTGETTPQMPKISESTGGIIEGTTTERAHDE